MSGFVCIKESEKMNKSKKYNVWITDHDGKRSMLTHRDKTAWTFRTAIKYAEEFVDLHGCLCTVVVEEDE
jgi:predicted site-specific integrase-resolvase